MTQSSEDRLPGEAEQSGPPTAQILPFERPQSALQKAVQVRAHEALELDRDRARAARKISPVRTLVIFVLAAIPVYLLFSAVDGFVRVMHKVNAMIDESAPTVTAPQSQPQPAQPGVVILVNPQESKASKRVADPAAPPQVDGAAPGSKRPRG